LPQKAHVAFPKAADIRDVVLEHGDTVESHPESKAGVALGVDPAAISSPTFVLIQEYDGRLPVYHFDAYRLPRPEAFEDLGVVEYWDSGVSLVEWADRVRGLLPERCWTITIQPTGPTARSVRIDLPPSARDVADRLAERLA